MENSTMEQMRSEAEEIFKGGPCAEAEYLGDVTHRRTMGLG